MPKKLKTVVLITAIVTALAACAGGGQTPSQPAWKSYGFDGAGAR